MTHRFWFPSFLVYLILYVIFLNHISLFANPRHVIFILCGICVVSCRINVSDISRYGAILYVSYDSVVTS
jgi:hypothetical protein